MIIPNCIASSDRPKFDFFFLVFGMCNVMSRKFLTVRFESPRSEKF